MKKSTVYVLALALVLSAVTAFADNGDDVQKAINAAGFGVKEGTDGSAAEVRDPNAPGGSRYSDQASQPSQSGQSGSDYGVDAWANYKFHTYMNLGDIKYNFKTKYDESPLPKPDSATDYYYPERFNLTPFQTVIGRPSSASDPIIRNPSPFGPPWDYSGDSWGDCLGPNCTDRGAFRAPVGSWVHFTHSRIEVRNDLQSNLGFPDTIQVLSNEFRQPVVELRNGRE